MIRVLYIVFALSLVANLALAFQATDEEKTFQGITYACTGVGESKEDPRWEKYPLKLMFTARGTAYVSYVQVKIKDSAGKVVFEADCDSPWLVAKLKPGSYEVTATAEKKFTRKMKVQIKSEGQTVQVIRFSEISGE